MGKVSVAISSGVIVDCVKILIKIVDLLTRSVGKRVSDIGIEIELTQEAKELLAKEGYDPQYGARPLRRVIQSMVEDSLSEAILDGVVSSGNIAKVDVEDGQIVIRNGGPVVTAEAPKEEEPA